MNTYQKALRRFKADPSPETATNLPYLFGVASSMHGEPRRTRLVLRGWVQLVLVAILVVAVLSIPEPEHREEHWMSAPALESLNQ